MPDLTPPDTSSWIIHDGFAYWKSKCGQRAMPRWSDICPEEIKSLLPHIVVTQVLSDPLDFIEKITGDAVLSHNHKNSMGIKWRNFEGRGPDSTIWNILETIVNQKQPTFRTIPYVGRHEKFLKMNAVTCPISDDGETVSKIISFVDYVPIDAGDVTAKASSQYMNRFTI